VIKSNYKDDQEEKKEKEKDEKEIKEELKDQATPVDNQPSSITRKDRILNFLRLEEVKFLKKDQHSKVFFVFIDFCVINECFQSCFIFLTKF